MSDVVERATSAYHDALEERVKGMVGLTFRGTVEVKTVRPRWMPWRVYAALMRTIVVVEHKR